MFFRRLAQGALAVTLVLPLLAATAIADPAKPATPAAAPEPKPIIKSFGTWGTRCTVEPKNPKKKDCFAFVDVRIENNERLFFMGVGYLPKKQGEIGAFAITPLGTLLPPGVGINIDDKVKFGAPFIFCGAQGCQADMPLTSDQVKAMRNGKVANIIFRLVGRGDAKIPLKLDGFGKAIDSLEKPKGP
ncbi:MAG TPA: invasion associated locus B family protein [Parvibaculum sp.]